MGLYLSKTEKEQVVPVVVLVIVLVAAAVLAPGVYIDMFYVFLIAMLGVCFIVAFPVIRLVRKAIKNPPLRLPQDAMIGMMLYWIMGGGWFVTMVWAFLTGQPIQAYLRQIVLVSIGGLSLCILGILSILGLFYKRIEFR